MSMAIQYAMQKRSKKMASGGRCEHGSTDCEMCHGGMYAKGGAAERQKPHDEEHPKDMVINPYELGMTSEKKNPLPPEKDETFDLVERIMKHRAKKYSEGGEVANDTPIKADFEDNQFDDLVKDDDLEMHYTAKNSGDELGNEALDEENEDLIDRIMKSRRLKDKMPY